MVSNILQEFTESNDVKSSEGILTEFIESDMDVARIDYKALGKDKGNAYAALRSYAIRHKLHVRVELRRGEILLKRTGES